LPARSATSKAKRLSEAVAAKQVLADFEREIGYPDAEKDAADVDALRAKLDG